MDCETVLRFTQVDQVVIQDLVPLSQYQFMVQPYNEVGDGPASKKISVETPAGNFFNKHSINSTGFGAVLVKWQN